MVVPISCSGPSLTPTNAQCLCLSPCVGVCLLIEQIRYFWYVSIKVKVTREKVHLCVVVRGLPSTERQSCREINIVCQKLITVTNRYQCQLWRMSFQASPATHWTWCELLCVWLCRHDNILIIMSSWEFCHDQQATTTDSTNHWQPTNQLFHNWWFTGQNWARKH